MSERSAVFDVGRVPDSPSLDQQPSSPLLDRMFDVLAADYRRQVVARLAREGSRLSFETLVTSVAATRAGV